MTKDEAITHLDYLAKCTPLSSSYTLALQMGIEALNQAKCEDHIEIMGCKDCQYKRGNGGRCYHYNDTKIFIGEQHRSLYCPYGKQKEKEDEKTISKS